MDLLPNWSLTFDPAIWETQNTSYGLQAKYGIDVPSTNLRIMSGVDLDYGTGNHFETSIDPNRAGVVFDSFTDDADIYDYDVTFAQASPYLQADYDAGSLSFSAGVRADFIRYDYENHLSVVQTGSHLRPADASPSFQDVTPKFGITYNPLREFGVFGSLRHGFRSPSEG